MQAPQKEIKVKARLIVLTAMVLSQEGDEVGGNCPVCNGPAIEGGKVGGVLTS